MTKHLVTFLHWERQITILRLTTIIWHFRWEIFRNISILIFWVVPFLSAGSVHTNMWSRCGAGQLSVSSEVFLPAEKNFWLFMSSLPATASHCQALNNNINIQQSLQRNDFPVLRVLYTFIKYHVLSSMYNVGDRRRKYRFNTEIKYSEAREELHFPVGLIGQTWFISCLFFMKLRPQKWQVPVLRVTAAELAELAEMRAEAAVVRVLGRRVGSRVLLTRESGGPVKNSSVRLDGNYQRPPDWCFSHISPGSLALLAGGKKSVWKEPSVQCTDDRVSPAN